MKMYALLPIALLALLAKSANCEDSAIKTEESPGLDKRGGKINYRRLARGLHMLRLGKRGATDSLPPSDFEFDDSDSVIPYENFEEYIPTEQEYEIPSVSTESEDAEDTYGPEEGGEEDIVEKRPMSMLRLGKRPMSLIRLGKRPMSMLRLGKRPMSMLRLGKRPMSMLRLGKRPMSMLRLGKRPMSMLRLGKKAMKMLRLGKRPMSMLRLGKRPMSMLRLGKRPSDQEADVLEKRPMSMLRLG